MSDPGRAARAAAVAWGLAEPRHVRTGMSSLWVVDDEVVLRVTTDVERAERAHWLGGELLRRGVRVPKSLGSSVFRHDEWVVARVEHVHATGSVDWAEVGSMVRRVHQISPADLAARIELPWCGAFPHWNLDRHFADICGGIDAEARAGMRACLHRWDGWRHVLVEAPSVLCHGDLHPGNVIAGPNGAVLIDWDMICVGPVAWDHAPLMRWEDRWSDRWGGGAGTYDAFAAGYGRSLCGDWVGEALAEIRLLVATLMRVRLAATNPDTRPELERRLQWWRGDPDAPKWEPQ
jgi:Ser/Thr protein kinase RdoA (MazF antagonist)